MYNASRRAFDTLKIVRVVSDVTHDSEFRREQFKESLSDTTSFLSLPVQRYASPAAPFDVGSTSCTASCSSPHVHRSFVEGLIKDSDRSYRYRSP
jgi:hypothetical protein